MTDMPHCSILSVGREILLGQTVDTNASFLASELCGQGWELRRIMAVDDILADIVGALRELAAISKLVIVTGGLGPTPDDLTREAFAAALGTELIFQPELMQQIEERFASFQRAPSPSNRLQAFIPAGTTALPNSCGTAPGMRGRIGDCEFFFMPGVPREMKRMFADHVLPALPGIGGGGRARYMKCFHLHGMGESRVGELIPRLCELSPECEIGTAVTEGVIVLRLLSFGATPQEASEKAARAGQEVERALADSIFGVDGTSLARCVVELLRARRRTLSLAESCTGGLIAADIVGIPGASDVLLEGIVCYSNESKNRRLEVAAATLERYGAVSRETVIELARNSRRLSGADYALAVSGIAGPGGGTPQKPVGTVWLALADVAGVYWQHSVSLGDRQTIRGRAANSALDLLRRVICGLPLPQGCDYAAD